MVTSTPPTVHLPKLLVSLGMTPLGAPTVAVGDTGSSSVSVLLDGRVVGEVSQAQAADIAIKLRTLKALGKEKVHPYSQPWYIYTYMPRASMSP